MDLLAKRAMTKLPQLSFREYLSRFFEALINKLNTEKCPVSAVVKYVIDGIHGIKY